MVSGNLRADAPHCRLDIIEKQITAAHDSASQADDLGDKDGDQISQPQADVTSLAFDGTKREYIALSGKLAYVGGRRKTSVGIDIRESRSHRRTAREAFPATVQGAVAEGSTGIDQLVAKFGMGAAHAAIQLAVLDNPAADPGTDRDIDQDP